MSAKATLVTEKTKVGFAAERAARDTYGRLVAWLAYKWRDVAAAEDAMATALMKALELWPVQGVPTSPDAWLLSVAKRELLQTARSQRLHASPEVQALLQGEVFDEDTPAVPDARLKLLFVCAHPAIDASIRPALMLQTVLGLDAQVVAQAMLTSPAAMAQRLVRAKQKIKDTQLRFEEPEASELPERLHAVLEAIYAAYGLGWDAVDGLDGVDASDGQITGLRSEALFLGKLVCYLLVDEPEAMGLYALMLYCEARIPARYTKLGAFVPLGEQDTQLWDRDAILQAEQLLRLAAECESPGPFQLEAAIQSAHCQRLFTGVTPWQGVAYLYEQLQDYAPSIGVQVARAVAWAQAGHAVKGQHLLDALEPKRAKTYQPYWVANAYLAGLQGDTANQVESLNSAIGLTSSSATRQFLLAQRAQLLQ